MSNPLSSLILRPTVFQSTDTVLDRAFFLDIGYIFSYKIYLWAFNGATMQGTTPVPAFLFYIAITVHGNGRNVTQDLCRIARQPLGCGTEENYEEKRPKFSLQCKARTPIVGRAFPDGTALASRAHCKVHALSSGGRSTVLGWAMVCDSLRTAAARYPERLSWN